MEVEAFGRKFKIEVIAGVNCWIDTKMDYINYSKLCKDLTGVKQKFKDICKDNKSIVELIYNNEPIKFHSLLSEDIKDELKYLKRLKFNVSRFIDLGILEIFKGYPNKIAGTYGPRYLLDGIFTIISKPRIVRIDYQSKHKKMRKLVTKYINLTEKMKLCMVPISPYFDRISDEMRIVTRDILDLFQISYERYL